MQWIVSFKEVLYSGVYFFEVLICSMSLVVVVLKNWVEVDLIDFEFLKVVEELVVVDQEVLREFVKLFVELVNLIYQFGGKCLDIDVFVLFFDYQFGQYGQ